MNASKVVSTSLYRFKMDKYSHQDSHEYHIIEEHNFDNFYLFLFCTFQVNKVMRVKNKTRHI